MNPSPASSPSPTSSFASSPTSSPALQKPPRARLCPSSDESPSHASTRSTRPSPSVARSPPASGPVASVSDHPPSYVELLRPDGSAYSPPRSYTLDANAIDHSAKRRSITERNPSGGAADVTSLDGRRGSTNRASTAASWDRKQRDSAKSLSLGTLRTLAAASVPLPPSRAGTASLDGKKAAKVEGGGSTTSTSDRGASLSQLSWGSWWPFQVVEPEGTASTSTAPPPPHDSRVDDPARLASSNDSAPTPPRRDSHESSRSFLSLFAGRQAIDPASAKGPSSESASTASITEADRIEAKWLETDLDELRRLSIVPPPRRARDGAGGSGDEVTREADESPFRPMAVFGRDSAPDKSLPPTPTKPAPTSTESSASTATPFFPSLFSATSSSPLSSDSPASQGSSSKEAQSKPKATASLLSSFTLPNPFASTSSSQTSPSLFGPASPPLSSATPSRPGVPARHYSTSSRPRNGDETGPTASKGQVEGMVNEEDKQAVEEEVEENAEMFSILKDNYKAPKLPLVFCHGLFGFDHLGPASIKPLQFSYWVGVAEALEAMGVEVLIGRVPASASIEERAKVLCEMIGDKFEGREVNLIGHSMGGLDARFLISRLKPTKFKVRSVTTISTPHRGSSFADYLLEDLVGVERVPALLGVMKGFGVPGGGKAFDDLTTTKMARFNDETPDDPSVRYFSYGAEFTPSWSNAFRIPWGVVYEREGPNDGLVSVDSAKWGEYQATLHNVNHLDLVGWVGKVRYGWAELLGKPIKFKPISFFCAMAEMLAEEGY
ncbi:hypothetical protein JCM10212_002033 [Sporobolomyces blumeae]